MTTLKPHIVHTPPAPYLYCRSIKTYRGALSDFAAELFEKGFRFYVTLKSTPHLSRSSFEGLVNEWSKRINRKVLGRHWWKRRNECRRLEAMVFFEEVPFVHAHMILCPPVTGYDLEDSEVITILQTTWGFNLSEKPSSKRNFRVNDLGESELRKCVNPEGSCHVDVLNTPTDAANVVRYSSKQMRVNFDFKFLRNIESRFPAIQMNQFNTPKMENENISAVPRIQ